LNCWLKTCRTAAKKIVQFNEKAKDRVATVKIIKKSAKKSAQSNKEKNNALVVEMNVSRSEVIWGNQTETNSTKKASPIKISVTQIKGISEKKQNKQVSTKEIHLANISASKETLFPLKNKNPSKTLAKGPKTPLAAAKPKRTPNSRTAPTEIWSGLPDEELEGGWPDGWIKKLYERNTGKSKGTKDRYWFSPKTNKKFRSMTEIRRFIPILLECNGNEDAAWLRFKGK